MSDSVMRKIENINCETESIEESWTGTESIIEPQKTGFLLQSNHMHSDLFSAWECLSY